MDARAMEIPSETLIEEAIDRGDATEAKRLLRRMVGDWRRNKEYSINWVASLLSFIGRRLGEPAVEEALRDFGERYLRARRAGTAALEASRTAEAITRAMKANGSEVEVREEADRIVLSFRCGSGGRLIDEGAYAPPRGYLTLREAGPRTLGRESLPVYCAHCPVNNEIQPIEWAGVPATVQFPPERPGERCVHHLYRDPGLIPPEIYRRAGKEPPSRGA